MKLQSNREQLLLVRKQCENCEESNSILEQKVKELVGQLDACRTHGSQLAQERDLLQKSFDAIKFEKGNVDRNRSEINAMVRISNEFYFKLHLSPDFTNPDIICSL